MSILNWRKWSLTVSLSVTMTLLVTVAVIGVTLLSINRETANFRSELQGQAVIIMATLEQAILNPLLKLDASALADQMGAFGDADVFVAGYIFDPNGRLIVDETSTPAFSLVVDPFAETLLTSNETIFQWNPDSLVAGTAVRLSSRTIGAISVELSTTSLVDKTNAANVQGLTVALVAGGIGIILSLLISRTITLPLRSMMWATQRIADGDLGQRVTVKSGGELIALANAFNNMTARLQSNIGELEQRTQALNKSNTELETINNALQVARNEALEAQRIAQDNSRLKSEFLSTMSHELRTPLNAIEGFTSIMLGGMGIELSDRAEDMVKRISANSKRLLSLINDFLDLSRIESGRLELVNEPVSPIRLAENWRHEVGVLAEGKGVAFAIAIDPNLPEQLYSDEDALSKIVINLLSNAFKFTHQGEVSLNLSRANGGWAIAVKDSGIGIPPHAREYIFDEFRQVDGSSKREYGGTGLGLALVQKLSRAMGGSVMVDSEVGVGSTFTVTLPLGLPAETVKQGVNA